MGLVNSPIEKAQKWIHDLLGWGYPLKRKGGDSFQPTFSCKFCSYKICQDSTGAWFHLSSKP